MAETRGVRLREATDWLVSHPWLYALTVVFLVGVAVHQLYAIYRRGLTRFRFKSDAELRAIVVDDWASIGESIDASNELERRGKRP